ncbi:hypothetical protein [Virgibacillus pantothenticus]|uniref:hypothetical protein n=1 Tax=Virgibacillus pantothenticus TaxID=1473 RepID=UPI001BB05600|nr:hypothetical protein [Virgibacillus pantothenticus]
MAIRDETLTPFGYSAIGETLFYLMDVKAELKRVALYSDNLSYTSQLVGAI